MKSLFNKHCSIRCSIIGLAGTMSMMAFSVNAAVVFSENFDGQPDWHSGMPENDTGAKPPGRPDRLQRATTHIMPENWYSIRQDPQWAPSVGDPDRHETIEILASNADKARGGTGKSYVSWRDSTDQSSYWNSDSQLLKYFPEGYDEMYVEFWIRFSPDWTKVGGSVSKIFRVGSWSGVGNEYKAFSGGEQGPLYLWDWKVDGNGVRNSTALRGGPWGENYNFSDSDIAELPRSSLNFTADTEGMGVGGTTPKIPDQVNGGYISDDLSQTVWHEQIYGTSGHWTKMAFYVKMNSSIGARDGIFRQWINNVQVVNLVKIPWVKANSGNKMVKWNFISIGGNDYFHVHPSSQRHEEWYSIDDLVIMDSLPEEFSSLPVAPNPPTNVVVK